MSDTSQPQSGAPDTSTSAAPAAVSDADRAETWYPKEAQADAEKDTAADPKEATESDSETPYQLTPPDGFDLDPVMTKEATPIFREIGLDDSQANKLLPLAGRVVERFVERQHHEFLEVKNEWAKATKADPDIGGANWSQTERLFTRALDAAGAAKGSEFRKLLNETGLGNHPAFIRGFRNIGRKLGGAGPTPPKSREETWYPNQR